MKKFFKYLAFALIALIFIGTFVYLFSKSRPKEIIYKEIPVEIKDIRKTSVVTGRIEPRNEVNIKPQINGIISELYKEAGQMVREGEVIARLKVIPDMGSLSSAESRLRLAELNLKQAETDYRREKQLYDKDLVSADEYDKVVQSLKQAEEEHAAAKEALEVIRDGVSSTNATGSTTLVRSTITGLILDIPVKVGNSVIQANTMNDGTTVATVADMSDLIFNGSIDETEVGALHEGMPMSITLGALPDYRSEAFLEYISPKAVEKNGSNQFEIKAALSRSSDVTIRSGYSANAEIVLQEAKGVLSLQESALEFRGDSTFVYLKTGEKQYESRPVVTGISDGIDIEIKSGLKEGDVVRGPQQID
ncbi:MAG: efflux RND transporter periplasmic adaptor subunit [Candidatus Cryptobacteroides sp.]|nr:efflux RND transporter periplasmic adaptor subunit [Bacteroidales bacterium]MDY6158063.1 efflux RND transporter periplasmic adaptor subunit [Candidatus Cryptobacteroides sp.]